MFVLGTNKRTNKNFISLVILGKYVRIDLRKTPGSQLFFSHVRKLKASASYVFSPKFLKSLGDRVATSNQDV